MLAGALAVIGVVLTQYWPYYFLRGTSEVVLIGVTLGAIDRLLDGRRAQAFVLAVAAGLIRPEWWPFIGLYALWLWFREPALAQLACTGCSSLPACSCCRSCGSCRRGSAPVSRSWPPATPPPTTAISAPTACALSSPAGSIFRSCRALIAAVIAVALGWWRRARPYAARHGRRDRRLVGGRGRHDPGRLSRPGALLPARRGPDLRTGRGRHRPPGASSPAGAAGARRLAVAAAAAARAVRSASRCPAQRIAETRAAIPAANRAVATLHNLDRAVAAAGGHHGVFPCLSSFAAVNHGVQTALAWKLHVTLERVGTSMRAPGVDFIGPHNATDGAPAPVDPRLTRHEHVAEVGRLARGAPDRPEPASQHRLRRALSRVGPARGPADGSEAVMSARASPARGVPLLLALGLGLRRADGHVRVAHGSVTGPVGGGERDR